MKKITLLLFLSITFNNYVQDVSIKKSEILKVLKKSSLSYSLENENEFFSKIGKTFFLESKGYESKEEIAIYEPITYFDKNDPPIFL